MVSRRRKKELKRLRKGAEELWADQQVLLDRAGVIFKEGQKQATHLTQEELVPRLKTAYDDRLRSRVEKGAKAGQNAASSAKDVLNGTVLPAVTAAAGAATTIAASLKDQALASDTGKRAAHFASDTVGPVLRKAGITPPPVVAKKRGIGAGGVIGIVLGLLVLAGVGYAVWQTLRADDDLWVADDEPEVPPADPAA